MKKLKLKESSNEKDVENVFRSAFDQSFETASITSPHGTDGILKDKEYKIHCLLEFKYDKELKNQLDRNEVLVQCLYYMKKHELAGKIIPSTIFVGDVNECFVISSKPLVPYLSRDDIDWSIAPSHAAHENPELLIEFASNEEISPHVFDIDSTFKFKSVIEKIIDLSTGSVKLIPITSANIIEIFRIFKERVVKDKVFLKDTQKLSSLFVECLINSRNVYIHPNKKNMLVTERFGNVKVKQDNYKSLFSHFKQEYSPSESRFITEQKDRLVEDTERRKTGEFFTPAIWALEAHKEIEKVFGPNWKKEFRVWDPAAGTANLTKDAQFDDLYISTLNQEDIDTINTMGYNKGAKIFQFDFLNDPDDKLPEELLKNDKPLLILMNPPYGSQNSAISYKSEGKRTDGSKTNIAIQMNKDKMSHACKQMYTQFIYKIVKLKQKYDLNIQIGMFTPEGFMTKPSFKNFRELFYKEFEFKNGFVFKADEFADVKAEWPICFSIWE